MLSNKGEWIFSCGAQSTGNIRHNFLVTLDNPHTRLSAVYVGAAVNLRNCPHENCLIWCLCEKHSPSINPLKPNYFLFISAVKFAYWPLLHMNVCLCCFRLLSGHTCCVLWVCLFTSHWTPLMGSRPDAPIAALRWASCSTTAATPSPQVRLLPVWLHSVNLKSS